MNRQKYSRSRSAAFTLVELLVVITIIGMLIGLLLPAVQAARESARKVTCMNNQKNISLAMINFEGSRKYFPGHLTNLTVGSKSLAVSWLVPILPHLEHRDIYDMIQNKLEQANGDVITPAEAAAFTKSISILVCPSDPPPSQGAGTTWMSYVVNRGRNTIDDDPSIGVCPNHIPFHTSNPASSTTVTPAKVGLDYISSHDGASTTLLLSESLLTDTTITATAQPTNLPYMRLYDNSTWYYYRPYSEWMNTTAWASKVDGELTYGFEWSALEQVRAGNATPRVNDQISCRHPGVIIASFCDGHQMTISESMDVTTFKHLMTPYGQSQSCIAYGGPTDILDEGNL